MRSIKGTAPHVLICVLVAAGVGGCIGSDHTSEPTTPAPTDTNTAWKPEPGDVNVLVQRAEVTGGLTDEAETAWAVHLTLRVANGAPPAQLVGLRIESGGVQPSTACNRLTPVRVTADSSVEVYSALEYYNGYRTPPAGISVTPILMMVDSRGVPTNVSLSPIVTTLANDPIPSARVCR